MTIINTNKPAVAPNANARATDAAADTSGEKNVQRPVDAVVQSGPTPMTFVEETSHSTAVMADAIRPSGGRRASGRLGGRIGEHNCVRRHSSEPVLERAFWTEAKPGDTWSSIVRAHYGEHLSPEVLALLAGVAAYANGQSIHEAPKAEIGLPDLNEVKDFLRGLKEKHGNRFGKPSEVGEITRARWGNRDLTPVDPPSVGRAYETRWNDDLRSVVLLAYRDHLKSVPPEKLFDAVQGLMAMVAEVNGINKLTLGDAGIIYLPTLDEGRASIANHGQVLGLTREFHDRVVRAAVGAEEALASLQDPPVLAPRFQELENIVWTARVQISVATQPFNMYGFPFYVFDLLDVGKGPQAMRDGETPEQFLARTEPALSPEERAAAVANPLQFVLEKRGFKNADGTPNQEKINEFYASLNGLIDTSVTIVPRTVDGRTETAPRLATRFIMEQITERYPIEWKPDEEFSAILQKLMQTHPDAATELAKLETVHALLTMKYETEVYGVSSSLVGPPAPNEGVMTLNEMFHTVFAPEPTPLVYSSDIFKSLKQIDGVDAGSFYFKKSSEESAPKTEAEENTPHREREAAAIGIQRREARQAEKLKDDLVEGAQRSVRSTDEQVKEVKKAIVEDDREIEWASNIERKTGKGPAGPYNV